MRLTLEALGHVLTVTLKPSATEPNPPQPGGDVYADTERRGTDDHGGQPIGFRRAREDG